MSPIRRPSGPDVDAIEIRPPDFDMIIRCKEQLLPSKLAMLAELCNIPEQQLRQLQGADVDRVMIAFMNVLPPTLQADVQNPEFPLSTPNIQTTGPIGIVRNEDTFADDPIDPRFPKVDGPVNRFPAGDTTPTPTVSGAPTDELQVGPNDDIVKVVGA